MHLSIVNRLTFSSSTFSMNRRFYNCVTLLFFYEDANRYFPLSKVKYVGITLSMFKRFLRFGVDS